MKILELNVMRGPNFWSVKNPQVVVLKIDIQELEEFTTSSIPEFAERLKRLMPSLMQHKQPVYSYNFIRQVEEGAPIPRVIKHIAMEMQNLAGSSLKFGYTSNGPGPGVYNIIFEYEVEKAGIFCAHAAVRIVESLIRKQEYNLTADLNAIKKMISRYRLGPSTQSIMNEAIRLGIPVSRDGEDSALILGQGSKQKRIQATITSATSNMAVEVACDKQQTKNILSKAGVPVAQGEEVYNVEELLSSIEKIDFPLVIKPSGGNHGKGAGININNVSDAIDAFKEAQKISKGVIVERYVKGSDFRFLVINHKLVAAAKRIPASVTGDGVLTISQLIELENSRPERGDHHDNVLTKITIDECSINYLKECGLTLNSVPNKGTTVYLKKTANLSTGGVSVDVTDIVHPYNVFLAERISRLIGLDICGIDIMAPNVFQPLNENGGIILEVNAAPGFRMHLAPSEGKARNVARPVLEMLFPDIKKASIPTVAVTGTNGKTTTTRLIAHMAQLQGYRTGYTTTEGIYIQGRLMERGDCTGPASANFILRDPMVDFAVLECARGGILRSGLGFRSCDIGIVTNIAEDHLGIKDINTVEDMARVKRVIPETVKTEGYSILNADDNLVFSMAEHLDCNIALFSLKANNQRVISHCNKGGLAAYVEEGKLIVNKAGFKTHILDIDEIPLTIKGKALFMVQNVLPAVLTGFIREFRVEVIKQALLSFIPSPQQTPGRLNLYDFQDFTVMLDYAHNAAGLKAISGFIKSMNATTNLGIITAVGDRRDEDIKAMGAAAAGIFDQIIIRLDKDLRGRSEFEMISLLESGIRQVNKSIPVSVIHGEQEAIEYAVKHADTGSFIAICSEDICNSIKLLNRLHRDHTPVSVPKEQKFKLKPGTILPFMLNPDTNPAPGKRA